MSTHIYFKLIKNSSHDLLFLPTTVLKPKLYLVKGTSDTWFLRLWEHIAVIFLTLLLEKNWSESVWVEFSALGRHGSFALQLGCPSSDFLSIKTEDSHSTQTIPDPEIVGGCEGSCGHYNQDIQCPFACSVLVFMCRRPLSAIAGEKLPGWTDPLVPSTVSAFMFLVFSSPGQDE